MPEKKWNPEKYDKQSVLQYRTAMKMLESFVFYGNEKVLDVGTGSGKISNEIAQRVPNGSVIGLDRNHEMIEFAKQKYTLDNLSFIEEDIIEMNFSNEFDVVVSFWTLSWVPMDFQVKALNNIIRSLKENGRLLLMYPTKHDAYDVVNSVIRKPEWQDYFISYPPPREFISEEKYRYEILTQLSLGLNVEQKEIPCRYKNDHEMKDSINCWLSHVDRIPEDKKDAFLTDVAESYKAYHHSAEPIMYYSTLEITGLKPAFRLSQAPHLSFEYNVENNNETKDSLESKEDHNNEATAQYGLNV